jgi:hypothetical protein
MVMVVSRLHHNWRNWRSIFIKTVPISVVAWQFQGAIPRKLGNVEAAYQAYHEAAIGGRTHSRL